MTRPLPYRSPFKPLYMYGWREPEVPLLEDLGVTSDLKNLVLAGVRRSNSRRPLDADEGDDFT